MNGARQWVPLAGLLAALLTPGAQASTTPISKDDPWQAFDQRTQWHHPLATYPYQACFESASVHTGIPVTLLLAVARGESQFRPDAVSKANAIGIMQIQWPGTARHLGFKKRDELFLPCENIQAGARYLKELNRRYPGDWHRTLAAYNYGPGRIKKGKPLPSGAVWYSEYIQDHLEYIVTRKKADRRAKQKEVIAFEHAWRARGYVKFMKQLHPETTYSWFETGRTYGRFVVYVEPES